jgi:hypothetical protein
MGTKSRIPALALRVAEGLLAVACLAVVDLRIAFPAHGARSSFLLLALCDAASLALLAHALGSVSKSTLVGSAAALAPSAYYLLPGSDAAGAPWAWLFAIVRVPALGSAAGVAVWLDPRDRWTWAAVAAAAAPLVGLVAVRLANQ